MGGSALAPGLRTGRGSVEATALGLSRRVAAATPAIPRTAKNTNHRLDTLLRSVPRVRVRRRTEERERRRLCAVVRHDRVVDAAEGAGGQDGVAPLDHVVLRCTTTTLAASGSDDTQGFRLHAEVHTAGAL